MEAKDEDFLAGDCELPSLRTYLSMSESMLSSLGEGLSLSNSGENIGSSGS